VKGKNYEAPRYITISTLLLFSLALLGLNVPLRKLFKVIILLSEGSYVPTDTYILFRMRTSKRRENNDEEGERIRTRK
jgi:hypothetical protein